MGQGKLVRDKIPQIIRSKGLQPITYVADVDEYGARLWDKLAEEVDEFIASTTIRRNSPTFMRCCMPSPSMRAPAESSWRGLQAAKAAERGAFTGRIIWCGNHP